MKNEALIYGMGFLVTMLAVVLVLLQWPYANSLLILTLSFMLGFQSIHIMRLKKKIKQLEK